MDLRPRVSEKDDHQRGKIDMDSIYIATLKFVIVGVVWRSEANCGNAAGNSQSGVQCLIAMEI